LVDQWLKRKRALRLASSCLIGVNPDHRLHEDSRNLAESTTGLVLGLLQSTILLEEQLAIDAVIAVDHDFFAGLDHDIGFAQAETAAFLD
ncbi:hypothetical protein AB9F39_36305, partial [Rhizobium leguminosarum]|uniref:hypothetical protein n=1 Tax=Rhizobium leguminosarum TaxID=384 RepID=UPI003F97C1C3